MNNLQMNWQGVANAAHLLFLVLLIISLSATIVADRDEKFDRIIVFWANAVVFLLLCGIAKH